MMGCGLPGGGKHATAPPKPPLAAPTPSTLQAAKEAEAVGRFTEALALYDALADGGRAVDKSMRVEALAHAAVLRLTPDPARRDLLKAHAMLAEVNRLDPQYTTPIQVGALFATLQDVQSLRARTEALDAALKNRDRQQANNNQPPDQKSVALKNENTKLREEIKALQAELARKEEALRRTAEKLLGTPPSPQ
jgi:hypothetical protein